MTPSSGFLAKRHIQRFIRFSLALLFLFLHPHQTISVYMIGKCFYCEAGGPNTKSTEALQDFVGAIFESKVCVELVLQNTPGK